MGGNVLSTLDAYEAAFLRYTPRPDLYVLQEYLKKHAYRAAAWTKDKQKLEARRSRFKARIGAKYYDKIADNFMQSSALLTDQDPGSQWEATELLGQGSFGTVGLWEEFKNGSRTGKSVAIKETRTDGSKAAMDMIQRRDGGENIPAEAYFTDLCSRTTPHIPYLHALKLLRGDNGSEAWRYYSEYCPYGDIGDLIQNYKNYNDKNRHIHELVIPELHIWATLYGLAHALVRLSLPDNLEQQVDRELRHDVKQGKKFVMHMDIKDANIMLGSPYNYQDLKKFPLAKLGDFGLATLTSRSHKPNAKWFKYAGTREWDPPEQWHAGTIDEKWNLPLIHPNHDSNYAYDLRHSVWQIAAVCWSMCIQVRDNEWLEKEIAHFASDPKHAESTTRLAKGNFLDQKFHHKSFKDYETDLMHTLNRCLNFVPARRLWPNELLEVCRESIAKEVDRLNRKDMKYPQLFYGKNAPYEMVDYARGVHAKQANPQARKRRNSGAVPAPKRESKVRRLSRR